MKFLIVFYIVVACSLAATVPRYEPISTIEESRRASGELDRVANGQPAVANQIPHQCSVRTVFGSEFATCGGSIISPSWVLTAAHCTKGIDQFNLRFGTLTLLTGGVAQTSFTAIIHPQYNSVNSNNDVSLVQIPTALSFSAAIQHVRLPTVVQVDTTFIDVQAVLSGWGETAPGTGASQTLNWVFKRPIPNSQCAGIYGMGVVVGHVICTLGYFSPGNQGVCGGDSGGPLTIVENGVVTQIGIVSFAAFKGCNLGYPSGFMRTSHFVQWIAGHTGIPVRT